MTRLTMVFYRFSEWVTRFAYVNLLWVVFTLLGLVIFGITPATAGMFAVIRKWLTGEHDVPVFKTFWEVYRKDFLKLNALGLILAFIGYFIYIEFSILRTQTHIAYYIASFGVIAQMILYFVVLIYFFPIFVHFNLKFFDYLKWPFLIGFIHPIMTIFLAIVTNVLLYILYVTIPAIIFFFGGSIVAYILTWGASKTFSFYEKIEKREA